MIKLAKEVRYDETKKTGKLYEDVKKIIDNVEPSLNITEEEIALIYAGADTLKKQIRLYEEFIERYPKEYCRNDKEMIVGLERLAELYEEDNNYRKAIDTYDRLIKYYSDKLPTLSIDYFKKRQTECGKKIK